MKTEKHHVPLLKRPAYKPSIPVQATNKKLQVYTYLHREYATDKTAEDISPINNAYNHLLNSNKKYKQIVITATPNTKKSNPDLKAHENEDGNLKEEILKIENHRIHEFINARVEENRNYRESLTPTMEKEFDDIAEAKVKMVTENYTTNPVNKIVMSDQLFEFKRIGEFRKAKRQGGAFGSMKDMPHTTIIPENRRTITDFKEIRVRKEVVVRQARVNPYAEKRTHGLLQFPALEHRKSTPLRIGRHNSIGKVQSDKKNDRSSLGQSGSTTPINQQRCHSQRTLHRVGTYGTVGDESPFNYERANSRVENTVISAFTPKRMTDHSSNSIIRKTQENDPENDERRKSIPRFQLTSKGRVMFNQILNVNVPNVNTSTVKPLNVSNNKGNTSSISANQPDPKSGIENFQYERVIGQGSYAIVRLASDRFTGQQVAIKTYEKFKLFDAQRRKNVKREIQLLQDLDHPNVIKLYKTIDTLTQVHLIQEYIGTGSLHTHLKSKENKKIAEDECREIFAQVVAGISHLHSKNIVHRDIKLENLLLGPGNIVKIIDFGFSIKIAKDKLLAVFCGTPSYMAPELATRRDYQGQPADTWALGVLLYAMLTGTFPFRGANDQDLFKRIARGYYEIPSYLSPEVQSLIRKMLRLNPLERPTAEEILMDPWVSGQQNSYRNLKDFLSNKIEEYRRLGTKTEPKEELEHTNNNITPEI
jgi:tRNA A-37 threonylcarbamoyl transferase component Bud32